VIIADREPRTAREWFRAQIIRLWCGLPETAASARTGGYLLAGTITVSCADREETYQAGDASYMTPGHVPAAEAGTEFIQFSPAEQLAETVAAMRANAQRTAQGG